MMYSDVIGPEYLSIRHATMASEVSEAKKIAKGTCTGRQTGGTAEAWPQGNLLISWEASI